MIVARTGELAEKLLAAGELRCPRCRDGQLTSWGYGRRRSVRDHDGTTITVRPRRTRCRSCSSTHIVMPAALQPRHADTTAVIGTALLHKANGLGHRRIAATMGRPVSTVRRWLRRLPPEHLDRLARDGTEQLLALDPDTFTALRYRGNMLHHALSLLSAAAYWDRRRYALGEPPWTLIGMYTRGRLLAPPG
ncbi:DUF6431 domain-containing protein [Mycobacterium sp. 4D054]|uniref:DUF6431 domain-containing protein n=1 Tax=unclassified Mycobacterium TaxID=2642494 RepID=UPI0021B386A6|nr:DUF6431 domain-containing protein [Mycobacterium sp. SMC-8]UXA10236.1 helix-turn-helix domain-containing protein [Mycobacterium sp. SMC-8]UXA11050.1 helix-turn-helix domain-containing protein [Mycobacterium sp. SMC-8]UXA11152.1 helix-turn-helix domain-containing protein [Mycobacterium sp. SMC-8]UXA11155.1 helix-turn-helix domain-containing protein [Mycobacterium sp. SMC-8]UXA11165.1 helix-turn-helix domain-containing protein [Mycobacterium sp. SMC-8]